MEMKIENLEQSSVVPAKAQKYEKVRQYILEHVPPMNTESRVPL